jgi:hypothetical protein
MMNHRVKEKRIIKVKHPQLIRFRTVMRELLKAVKDSERTRLCEVSDSIEKSNYNLWLEEKNRIERQIEELDRSGFRAPIGCRLCGRQDLDLVFNPCDNVWYCEECYAFNQEYYKNNPHPYEPDWRKLYP